MKFNLDNNYKRAGIIAAIITTLFGIHSFYKNSISPKVQAQCSYFNLGESRIKDYRDYYDYFQPSYAADKKSKNIIRKIMGKYGVSDSIYRKLSFDIYNLIRSDDTLMIFNQMTSFKHGITIKFKNDDTKAYKNIRIDLSKCGLKPVHLFNKRGYQGEFKYYYIEDFELKEIPESKVITISELFAGHTREINILGANPPYNWEGLKYNGFYTPIYYIEDVGYKMAIERNFICDNRLEYYLAKLVVSDSFLRILILLLFCFGGYTSLNYLIKLFKT